MEEFDYDKVINPDIPWQKDSLLLSTRIQALKAMDRYPEAIVIWLLFCKGYQIQNIDRFGSRSIYKLMGSPRQAADYYRKAVVYAQIIKFFRLVHIYRSLLNAENFKRHAMLAMAGWNKIRFLPRI